MSIRVLYNNQKALTSERTYDIVTLQEGNGEFGNQKVELGRNAETKPESTPEKLEQMGTVYSEIIGTKILESSLGNGQKTWKERKTGSTGHDSVKARWEADENEKHSDSQAGTSPP